MSLLDKYSVNKSGNQADNLKPMSMLERYGKPSEISQDKIYQQQKSPDLDSTQLTGRDRYEYAQDIAREREYTGSAGFVKNALSKLTFGRSEQGLPEPLIPLPKNLQNIEDKIQKGLGIKEGKVDKNALKPQDYENNKLLGSAVGIAAPAIALSTPAGLALGSLAETLGLGAAGKFGGQVLGSAVGGGAYEGLRQRNMNEEFDPQKIGEEALTWGAGHFAFSTLLAAGKDLVKFGTWLKGLKPEQQSKAIADQLKITDLEPNQYKYFQNEVVPELRQAAENEFMILQEAAIAENDATYQEALRRAQIEHEAKVREVGFENAQAKQEYQNELKQLAAEHQNKLQEIEQANQAATNEFQEFDQQFRQQAARQEVVQNAIGVRPTQINTGLGARITNFGPDSGIRPVPIRQNPSLQTKALDTISRNEITNKTNAGRTQAETIRGHAAIDYRTVNRLYAEAEQLNQAISAEHPELAQDLQNTIRTINDIPYPSPPQVQLRTASQALLERIAPGSTVDQLMGTVPVNNQILLEQAKALRYFMDFEFAQANPKGIFQPTLNAIDNAVELAAISAGDEAAYTANRAARIEYRNWTDIYNNDYVNPYRNRTNFDYIGNFDKSLSIDNYSVINRALSRSNIGQEVSDTTRRSLVDKHLGKFLKDPHGTTVPEFKKALAELDPVTSPSERASITRDYLEAKKSTINAKKVEKTPEPKAPKTKEFPTSQKIPQAPKQKVVTEAKIPVKQAPKVTEGMKEAAKQARITPEEVMKLTNTPTGLKTLRSKLSAKSFEKVGQYKVRDILYEGAVQRRLKGDELIRTVNKSDNYAILSEILGEAETKELLAAAEKIGDSRVTKDSIKKLVKPTTLKTLIFFGFF